MSNGWKSENSETDQGDEQAVLKALDDYQAAFSGHDPQRTQLSYHKPSIAFDQQDPQGLRILQTASEIEAFVSSTFQRLEARGWQYSKWLNVSAKQLGASVVLVSTVAVRCLKNGGELERIGGTYLFRKSDLGWKIAVLISHPPETAINLTDARFND